MGRDKAAIVFSGEPLWQRQLALLRQIRSEEIFISARTDPQWRPNDCKFVPDDSPSRGPLSGIAAALNTMRSTHLLVVAIDMPFMTEKFLQSLCDRVAPTVGALPKIRDRAEPLCAIYPRETAKSAHRALAGNDFSLQNWTAELVSDGKLKVVVIGDEDRELFRNLNEAADLD